MAEVLLFHHAHGQTTGFLAFADSLRGAGHVVHTPDLSAAIPASEFGGAWPPGVPFQVPMMESDPWAEEDLPAARELVESTEDAELFLYPGDRHLFADSSLPDYEEAAATLLEQRVRRFLEEVG